MNLRNNTRRDKAFGLFGIIAVIAVLIFIALLAIAIISAIKHANDPLHNGDAGDVPVNKMKAVAPDNEFTPVPWFIE